MNILRRFLVAVSTVVFFFSSLGLAWSHVFAQSLGDRETVKSWLSDGKFYDNIVDVVLESLATVDSQDAGEIPVTDPNLQVKVREVFTPDFLRSSSENVLDGVFNWLEGSADQPDFRLDLTDVRLKMASALGDYAVERGASLPVCSEVPADFDALSAECLPPGVAVADLKSQVENNLLNESTFIDEPIVTADTLKGEDGQSNVFQNTKEVRSVYRAGKNLPIVFAVLTVLSGIGLVLLSSSRRSGFLRLGIVSTVSAVVLGLGFMGLSQGPRAFKPDIVNEQGAQNLAAQELITGLFQTFAENNKKLIGLYAVGFALVAGASYMAYVTMGHRNQDETGDEPKDPKPPIDDSPKTDSAINETKNEKLVEKKNDPEKPARKIQL
jgi:hypothetical protein